MADGKISSIEAFDAEGKNSLYLWITSWLDQVNRRNGGSGISVDTTDGVITVDPTRTLEIGSGLTLTNPSANVAHLAAGVAPFVSQVESHIGIDLVAWWRMGESSGNQLDYAQNSLGDKPLSVHAVGTAGTYDVAGALPTGVDDGAYRVNYNQSIADAPSGADYFNASDSTNHRWRFSGTASFTVECFFKPHSGWSLPANPAGIVGAFTSVSNEHGWVLGINNDNTVFFRRATSTVTQTNVTSHAITSGDWHHLAATYDGTTMRLYVDGLLAASSASAVSISSGPDTITVCRCDFGVTQQIRYIYGDLDEIAVYNTALTAGEILFHAVSANLPNGPTVGDIIVYLNGVSPLQGNGINLIPSSGVTITTGANTPLDAVDVTLTATEALSTTDVTTNDVTSTKHGFAPKSPADSTKFLNGAATPAYAQVKDSDLATSDVTTNDASTARHGFLKKLSNVAANFLDGTGVWRALVESDLSLTDVTTNDVSITKHGFTPKAPNDASKFLRGDGTWAAVGGVTSVIATDTFWDAKGDLALGSGPDAAVRLPVGSDGMGVIADSTQTSGARWGVPLHYFYAYR